MASEFGKYQIIERLGGGGMAEVFRAVLTGPGGFEKHLALKLILPQFSDDEEFVRMFIHEATLAAVLDHTNIVRIHEFDQIDGRYYIAMELVDGKDLRAVLARARKVDRPLKIGEAVLVSVEVSRGLSFAHGELTPGAPEVIHRDISPHNVVLSRAGEVKITDFGIAKLSSSASFTKTGVVKGKLAYMSPEQASGLKLDKRSDLFSLGCVMWELLTGQRLFRAKNDMEALSKLKEAPILPPSTHNSAIPPELDQLVLRCLVRDREKRVSSASEICNDLDSVLRSLAIDDKATALAGLFRELFGTSKVRSGTAVMAMSENEDELKKLPPPVKKAPVEPEQIEPAGPEVETALDEGLVEKMPHGIAKVTDGKHGFLGKMRARSLGIGMVTGIVVLVLIVFLMEFGNHGAQNGQNGDGGISTADQNGDQNGDGGISTAGINVEKVEGGPGIAKSSMADSVAKSLQPLALELDGSDGKDGDVGGDGRCCNDGVKDGDGGAGDGVAGDGAASVKSMKRRPVGYLYLNVIPWAKVYKGKRFLGVTPLEHLPLVPGKHRLTLVNKELHARRSVLVVIRRGASTTKLLDLR